MPFVAVSKLADVSEGLKHTPWPPLKNGAVTNKVVPIIAEELIAPGVNSMKAVVDGGMGIVEIHVPVSEAPVLRCKIITRFPAVALVTSLKVKLLTHTLVPELAGAMFATISAPAPGALNVWLKLNP